MTTYVNGGADICGSYVSPLVSVVIPTLNEGDWVRRTVEAVLATSPGYPMEVIVVDDGSTDGSCGFLREGFAGSRNARVRLIKGGNLGSKRARNHGAAEARGEYLVFLDAHVLPDPGWLEELVRLLHDPSVGLAGLAVRCTNDHQCTGYTFVFVDENLGSGWAAPPQGMEPYETPCIIGCCVGVRQETFQELGGFDPGGAHWGVEDIELSLRTWFLGYRCLVSPRVQVAHYFKQNEQRNFSISWEEYDVNLLRCVLTYFSGRRLDTILSALRRRENFNRSLDRVTEDAAFWKRRDELRRRFCRDEEWFFARFAEELAPFERRLQELTNTQGDAMVMEMRRVICSQCGAINVGGQGHCLLCQAPLPLVGEMPQVCPNPACGKPLRDGTKFCPHCGQSVTLVAQPPVTPAERRCPKCGRVVPTDKKFCTFDGTRVP
jgi:GT2 family glycosyltransferase